MLTLALDMYWKQQTSRDMYLETFLRSNQYQTMFDIPLLRWFHMYPNTKTIGNVTLLRWFHMWCAPSYPKQKHAQNTFSLLLRPKPAKRLLVLLMPRDFTTFHIRHPHPSFTRVLGIVSRCRVCTFNGFSNNCGVGSCRVLGTPAVYAVARHNDCGDSYASFYRHNKVDECG